MVLDIKLLGQEETAPVTVRNALGFSNMVGA